MGDIDNMEYYIKFPNANQPNRNNALVANEDKLKAPVVLLFGWAGSKDKNLSKYSKIYEERGLITLRYTAPIKYLFWKRQHLVNIGDKIIKLLIDMNFENHPIFVHCFSNGGAFLYHGFSKALEKYSTPLKLKGVIFDSAPGARLLGFFRALSAIVDGNAFINFFISLFLTVFFFSMWYLQILSSRLFKSYSISDSFTFLREECNYCPQHFIFSKTDNLVYYKDIEDFIAIRKTKGVITSFINFDSSPHVQHFLYHRDEYIASVCKFIKDSTTLKYK